MHTRAWSRLAQDPPDDDTSPSVASAIETLANSQQISARVPSRVETPEATSAQSSLVVPVEMSAGRLYTLTVASARVKRAWSAAITDAVRLIAEIFASTLCRRRLSHMLADVHAKPKRMASANRYLGEENDRLSGVSHIIGHGSALQDSLNRLRQVASTDSSVLLLGETGTGKELFAKAIHARSSRRLRPLVIINCAALPVSLIDSELFGHERGAFTGANTSRQGRFELADHSTVFLDEIGDLPPEAQVKLLRVLQEREFERVGSSQTRKIDIRLVAATHHDLKSLVAENRFRADLFYRVSTFPITLPPLRERQEDIPDLVWNFVQGRQRALHREITDIPGEVMTTLMTYRWPGNVRELQNVVERALIQSSGHTLVLKDWPSLGAKPGSSPMQNASLEIVGRHHIVTMLDRCGWRINGAGNAAERLGLHPNTLRFRMNKMGIKRPAPQIVA
jgi:transcriptional regulator with GAF, ATPase, and Fis domain